MQLGKHVAAAEPEIERLRSALSGWLDGADARLATMLRNRNVPQLILEQQVHSRLRVVAPVDQPFQSQHAEPSESAVQLSAYAVYLNFHAPPTRPAHVPAPRAAVAALAELSPEEREWIRKETGLTPVRVRPPGPPRDYVRLCGSALGGVRSCRQHKISANPGIFRAFFK